MKVKHMDKLMDHLDFYFEQQEPSVYHSDFMIPHIDILKYEPTEKYPFYKLVTMGASDYKLSKINTIGRYNEYMVFVDKDATQQELMWHVELLTMIASFPFETNESISYRHSLELPDDENSNMKGVIITLPKVIKNAGILSCKIGFKTVKCLQLIPLTKEELDYKLKHGFDAIEKLFYPNKGESHYLSEINRTFKLEL